MNKYWIVIVVACLMSCLQNDSMGTEESAIFPKQNSKTKNLWELKAVNLRNHFSKFWHKVEFSTWEPGLVIDSLLVTKVMEDTIALSTNILWHYNDGNIEPLFDFNVKLNTSYGAVFYCRSLDSESNPSLLRRKLMFTLMDKFYSRVYDEQIYLYKIENTNIYTKNDNLGIFISPSHGCLGAFLYLTEINSSIQTKNTEYIFTHIGDIFPDRINKFSFHFRLLDGIE